MTSRYQNVMLTLIVLLLAAITVKLYAPPGNPLGPPLAPATRADFAAANKIKNYPMRAATIKELKARAPVVWIQGGDVDVTGEVAIDGGVTIDGGNVTVDGEVSINNPYR